MTSNTADDNGWDESAKAWIAWVDRGDPNRTLILDPVMLELCGAVRGLSVADIGCGEGRFCRMLSERGAQTTGVDPTQLLIDEARKRHPAGKYLVGAAEKVPLEAQSVDLAISYVALVDVPDHEAAIAEMARVLKPGGRIVACNLNAFATANLKGWTKDADGKPVSYPIDRYGERWSAKLSWAGMTVMQHHRPLSDVMTAFLRQGLSLQTFLEPLPTSEALKQRPGLADYFRVPIFWAMVWQKRAG